MILEENFLEKIHFDEKGLVPCVVQEKNGTVLMLAYMNEASLHKTIETGVAWYFSRSRQKLWQKGETSGNVQKVLSLAYDCDGDTLLMKVLQTGVACHTGSYSCFGGREFFNTQQNSLAVLQDTPNKENSIAVVLRTLYNVIQDRKLNPIEGSYTNYLFAHGLDKILKKVGEEATETIIASKNASRQEIIYEMGDLWYHCLVLMAYFNLPPEEVFKELLTRHQNKNSYHKFTGKTGQRPAD